MTFLFFLFLIAHEEPPVIDTERSATAEPAPPARAMSGGETTVFDTSFNAFGRVVANASSRHWRMFRGSKPFFSRSWTVEGDGMRTGLGPFYNAESCNACHFKDGRDRPRSERDQPAPLIMALSVVDDRGTVLPEPTYGHQIQDRATGGRVPEGEICVGWTVIEGRFPDGESYRLYKPSHEVTDLAYGSLHPETRQSVRIPPQVFGLGLLEAVPESVVLEHADPRDLDGNGISGRPNRVVDPVTGRKEIGRFGWKAGKTTVLHQVITAFNQDMGLTSEHYAEPPCPDGNCDAPEPDLDAYQVAKTVFYIKMLAVPGRRDWNDPGVMRGEALFREIGCESCHRAEMSTGAVPRLPELSNQVIRPFSDLLLHDMGDGLADGRPDGEASGREWRTAPLWGIGLIETIDNRPRYLHDGRASTLEEAILWHGGEAEASKVAYKNLSAEERRMLLRFLRSL